jgi:hypothetical protein
MRKKKASLFIYSFTIRYRREIAPFTKFNVVSKIVGYTASPVLASAFPSS